LGGTAAVVSSHRLANEFYGLPKDARRFHERTAKEVVHELGHLFGLVH
jgi:archaemetzincin